MIRYIVRRLLYLIPLVLGIAVISFALMQLAPGNFVGSLRLNPGFSEESARALVEQFGLDLPWWQQIGRWTWNLLHGNLGLSFAYQAPVMHIILSRAGNTLLLSIVAAVIAWLVALPVGIHAAVHRGGWSDKLLTIGAYLGTSIPSWFLALLVLYSVVRFGIDLPVSGATSPDYPFMSFPERIADRARHLLVPAGVLAAGATAGLMRYMRSSLLDVLRQEYVTTARAKGLSERWVIYKHAVRNAINPMITIFGFQLGDLLSGAALTEIVTGWPGLGKVTLSAVTSLDYYLVMGALVFSSVLLILGNLVADVLLALADPRIRYD